MNTPPDALGDQRPHAQTFPRPFGTRDQTQAPSLMPRSAASAVDLDEHVLLQFGEPFVRARLLAAALVLDQPAGGEDERELLGDALLDRRPSAHRSRCWARGTAMAVRQRRILRDEVIRGV
jgi:hypothetical protein